MAIWDTTLEVRVLCTGDVSEFFDGVPAERARPILKMGGELNVCFITQAARSPEVEDGVLLTLRAVGSEALLGRVALANNLDLLEGSRAFAKCQILSYEVIANPKS